jgi:hypothetical protein
VEIKDEHGKSTYNLWYYPAMDALVEALSRYSSSCLLSDSMGCAQCGCLLPCL